jgi:rSAM/selenodomain-associated transferase 2
MKQVIKISIIIPTLNERRNIVTLVHHLNESDHIDLCEIIVVDGGSSDGTVSEVQSLNVQLLHSEIASRATQMNLGASVATGEVLWFVHADVLPPKSFFNDIFHSIQIGYARGGYAFKFDSSRPLLRFNSWMTKLNFFAFRGGDQTLYVSRSLWTELHGYDEKFVVMEEYDFMRRAESKGYKHDLMKGQVLVSARKYNENSYLKVQWVNLQAMMMFSKGLAPQSIKTYYNNALKHPKAGKMG